MANTTKKAGYTMTQPLLAAQRPFPFFNSHKNRKNMSTEGSFIVCFVFAFVALLFASIDSCFQLSVVSATGSGVVAVTFCCSAADHIR